MKRHSGICARLRTDSHEANLEAKLNLVLTSLSHAKISFKSARVYSGPLSSSRPLMANVSESSPQLTSPERADSRSTLVKRYSTKSKTSVFPYRGGAQAAGRKTHPYVRRSQCLTNALSG